MPTPPASHACSVSCKTVAQMEHEQILSQQRVLKKASGGRFSSTSGRTKQRIRSYASKR